MLDWFRGEIPFLHDPIPAGRVVSVEPDGQVTWECVKKIECRSSHDTSLKIKSVGGDGQGRATALQIDGNLCKFLQGHNVFGSRDLNRLLLLSFRKVCELLSEHLNGRSSPDLAERQIMKGNYLVKMIDINQLYECGNDASVEAWLHAAEMRARSRHGRSTRDKGTLYLGKSSRRWAIKFYNKARELLAQGKTHKLPDSLQGVGLEEFIQGKLRAELRLFGKELEERHGITHGYHLTPEVIDQLFNTYLGKIDMSNQTTLIDEQLYEMPQALRSSYLLWRQGADLRGLLSKPTFYRQRKALLEYGIDINLMHQAPEHSNVVPLIRVIEAKPVAIPAWAYERGLIAA
ncbi:phage/plasmid replication protein, II/X family [Methylomicrobium sp. Wu6]|uniref:phage/plasmid replication protein, II/X family n=1 Tax=Methylomicrobium sp. Wu6 TaxID=3107928 RepID=UPI002DD63E10|nr:phage/plasmid replication protein, II/X family [Methylomicrobium sp. Wu6]MEC4749223.1 phage/plasmid replication protein, II/X family [Methylomicrobium sp. Wu6]